MGLVKRWKMRLSGWKGFHRKVRQSSNVRLTPSAAIDVDPRCDGCRWERVVVPVSQIVNVR